MLEAAIMAAFLLVFYLTTPFWLGKKAALSKF
jgi:hypothetical protein